MFSMWYSVNLQELVHNPQLAVLLRFYFQQFTSICECCLCDTQSTRSLIFFKRVKESTTKTTIRGPIVSNRHRELTKKTWDLQFLFRTKVRLSLRSGRSYEASQKVKKPSVGVISILSCVIRNSMLHKWLRWSWFTLLRMLWCNTRVYEPHREIRSH